MLWHRRQHGCGSWLPEDKKANMWHVRETCLPSPAPLARENSARYELKLTVGVQHYVQSYVQDVPVCPDYTVLFISWIWRIIKINRAVLQGLDKYKIFKGTI